MLKIKSTFFIFIFLCFNFFIFAESNTNELIFADDEMDLFSDSETDSDNLFNKELFPVSGYLESSLSLLKFPADNKVYQLQNQNKLKIKIDKKSEYVRLHAELNYNYYAGLTEANLLDYIPVKFKRIIFSDLYPFFDYTYENTLKLHQAYAVFPFKYCTFFLGRQPITFGTGYLWNPTDLFNQKNFLDPEYELTSHDSLKLLFPLPLNGEIRLSSTYRQGITNGDLGAAIKMHAGFDWEITWQKKYFHNFDFIKYENDYYIFFTNFNRITNQIHKWSYHAPNPLIAFDELHKLEEEMTSNRLPVYTNTEYYNDFYRYLYGLSFSGQILTIGVHGETAYIYKNKKNNYYKWMLGIDYTLNFQNQIMFEYLHNEYGRINKKNYTLGDWLALLNGDSSGLAMNYWFLSSSQTVYDIFIISLRSIYNSDDKSVLLMPEINCTLSDNAEIRFLYTHSEGSKNSEFGEFGDSYQLRFTLYY